MSNKLALCVAWGSERTYNVCFFCNGVSRCYSKNKCDYDHNKIKKNCYHGVIALDIVACKMYRLIWVFRNKLSEHWDSIYMLHDLLSHILSFLVVCRGFIIFPWVAVMKISLTIIVKKRIGNDSYTELQSVKHHIRRIRIQCAVIWKRNKTCYLKLLAADRQAVADFKFIIVSIHSVNSDLVISRRKLTVHYTYLVDILTIFEKPDSAVNFFCFFVKIKVFVYLYLLLTVLYLLDSIIIGFLKKFKISAFDIVFLKAFVISNRHTACRNKKAWYYAYHHCDEQK